MEAARASQPPAELGYRLGEEQAVDAVLAHHALMSQQMSKGVFEKIHVGANATFPLRAADLPEFRGPELGLKLKELEQRWIASSFKLSKAELLAG